MSVVALDYIEVHVTAFTRIKLSRPHLVELEPKSANEPEAIIEYPCLNCQMFNSMVGKTTFATQVTLPRVLPR